MEMLPIRIYNLTFSVQIKVLQFFLQKHVSTYIYTYTEKPDNVDFAEAHPLLLWVRSNHTLLR